MLTHRCLIISTIDFAIDPSHVKSSDLLTSQEKCKVTLDDNQFAYSNLDNQYAFNAIELSPTSQVYLGQYDKLITPEFQEKSSIDVDFSNIEYLMITNPLFKKSTEVLADFYNDKGIKAAIVDTEQIYQKYSYGVRELYSIKDLIKEVHTKGKGKLKHVLLVGDSSWDWRDNGENNQYSSWANRNDISLRIYTNFVHQKKYTRDFINRDFVPTGQYHSPEGHSASDNWFVSIVPEKNILGEDYIPDIAIGRFPGSSVEEIDAMIAKTIKYTNDTKVGPWKSRNLMDY